VTLMRAAEVMTAHKQAWALSFPPLEVRRPRPGAGVHASRRPGVQASRRAGVHAPATLHRSGRWHIVMCLYVSPVGVYWSPAYSYVSLCVACGRVLVAGT
jgi:hypothetical protein